MRKFKGVIIDDSKCIRASRFVCFGQFADGTKCYHEVDDNGAEIEGIFYTMCRHKIDGKTYQLFFVEGIE